MSWSLYAYVPSDIQFWNSLTSNQHHHFGTSCNHLNALFCMRNVLNCCYGALKLSGSPQFRSDPRTFKPRQTPRLWRTNSRAISKQFNTGSLYAELVELIRCYSMILFGTYSAVVTKLTEDVLAVSYSRPFRLGVWSLSNSPLCCSLVIWFELVARRWMRLDRQEQWNRGRFHRWKWKSGCAHICSANSSGCSSLSRGAGTTCWANRRRPMLMRPSQSLTCSLSSPFICPYRPWLTPPLWGYFPSFLFLHSFFHVFRLLSLLLSLLFDSIDRFSGWLVSNDFQKMYVNRCR